MYAAPSTLVPPPSLPTPMRPPSAPTPPLDLPPSEPPHPKAPRTSRANPDDDAGRIVQLCPTARRNWRRSYRRACLPLDGLEGDPPERAAAKIVEEGRCGAGEVRR